MPKYKDYKVTFDLSIRTHRDIQLSEHEFLNAIEAALDNVIDIDIFEEDLVVENLQIVHKEDEESDED